MNCENDPKGACVYLDDFFWFIHSDTVSNNSSGKQYNCNTSKNQFRRYEYFPYSQEKQTSAKSTKMYCHRGKICWFIHVEHQNKKKMSKIPKLLKNDLI